MKRAISLVALILSVALSIYAQQANAESDFLVKIIGNGAAVEITKYVDSNAEARVPERIHDPGVEITRL